MFPSRSIQVILTCMMPLSITEDKIEFIWKRLRIKVTGNQNNCLKNRWQNSRVANCIFTNGCSML